MRKILKTTAIVIVFLTTMLALAFTASAGVGGIFLSPYEQPENQVEGASAAAFDLWVTPGMRQEISFNVRNGRDYAVTVELGLNTAITNAGGNINYGATPDQVEFDNSLQFLLSDIASFPGGESHIEIEIPGRTTAIVPITLNVPNEGFDGVILGGVHALLGLTEAEREQGGMIVNRFANVMLIRLSMEGAPPVEPDFALGRVEADVVSSVGSFIARVHNPTPRISSGALASMWVMLAGTDADQALFYHENMPVDFAPHSIFYFILRDREGYGIFPGDYVARVRIEYDGRVWEFDEEFTVTAAAARAVAERAVGQAHMLDLIGTAGPSALTIGLISIAVLLLLAVIYLLLKIRKSQIEQQQSSLEGDDVNTQEKLKRIEDKLARLLDKMEEEEKELPDSSNEESGSDEE